MLNNVMLDVTIGLIFIYLLYSLLATTINEFIATIFTYRGKMLERGLEQMLDGTNIKYRWWNRLRNYLCTATADGKLATKNALFARKITTHALYQRAAEKGIGDKPSYIPADIFSDIIIDVLKGNLSAPILLNDIKQNLPTIVSNADLQKILTIYIDQANGDMQRFKLLLENWYNDMMDRVGGWYKRQANQILLIIGFLLAIVFNVSTIEIVHKLSTDKTTRDAFVASASAYVKEHPSMLSATTTTKPQADTVAKDTSSAVKGEPAVNKNKDANDKASVKKEAPVDDSLAAIKKAIANIQEVYTDKIEGANTLIGLGWGDFGYKEDSLKYKKDSASYAKDPVAYKDSLNNTWRHKICKLEKPVPPSPPQKPGPIDKILYVLIQTLFTPRHLIGFLITALAISLGAPFWFDLLNKFVNLRVSGAKPDDKSSTPVSKTASLNQKPDPTAKG